MQVVKHSKICEGCEIGSTYNLYLTSHEFSVITNTLFHVVVPVMTDPDAEEIRQRFWTEFIGPHPDDQLQEKCIRTLKFIVDDFVKSFK